MMKKQFCSFYLNRYLLGIEVLLVREIINGIDITPVDGAGEDVTGLLNLRGQIVTVIDPSVKLGFTRHGKNDSNSIIVLKTEKELEVYRRNGISLQNTSRDIIGLYIDKIDDMVETEESAILPAPANVDSIDNKYIRGVVKLKETLMTVLKIDELLKISK
ncbi:chemotaxis protein CheW [Chitinispirillales bacterium ANBcel5]|uniref:chemotaxis protein CheW n=1 Tax=Cellulosispirillum alkaliphilum TaxID=3039283 RepID=UPI002A4F37A7|nr:chemotaxis protein CheW [Chitinispirillales bacterium ANBcel5]